MRQTFGDGREFPPFPGPPNLCSAGQKMVRLVEKKQKYVWEGRVGNLTAPAGDEAGTKSRTEERPAASPCPATAALLVAAGSVRRLRPDVAFFVHKQQRPPISTAPIVAGPVLCAPGTRVTSRSVR